MIINRNKNSSLNILVTFIVLLSVLIASIGVGNAWFTSEHKKGIYFVVQIGEINLKLYQTIGNDENEILTKNDEEQANTPNYISLSDEILPEQQVALNLTLKNEDAGSGVYIRFKFEIYAVSLKYENGSYVKQEQLLPSEIIGGTNIVEKNGYYYYATLGENDSLESILFQKSGEEPASVNLMTHFKILSSAFCDENITLNGSEDLKIVLTIEGSTIAY